MADHGGYWSIDVPGLTKANADLILAYAKREFGLPGSAVDPQHWLTLHMDADTVRPIVQALELSKAAVADPEGAESVRETFADWLQRQGS